MKIKFRYDIAAPIYDRAAWVLSLGGIGKLHPALVSGLQISGSTVADLGCGTGLAFPDLLRAVGPYGRVIGLDSNRSILAKASHRVSENSWNNVSLQAENIATWTPPEDVDVVVSCIAMSCVPDPVGELESLLTNLRPGTTVRIVDALPRAEGRGFRLINLYNFIKAGIVGSHYRKLGSFETVFRKRLGDVMVDRLHGGIYTRLTGVKVA